MGVPAAKKRGGRKVKGMTWVLTEDKGGETAIRCRSCEMAVSPKDWWGHVCGSREGGDNVIV